MTSLGWLIAFVVFLGIEIATMALTTIWFAGGALAAFLASFAGAGIEVQLVVFVVVSFLLLIFTRPFVSRFINRNITKTNADRLVGMHVVVTEEIDNAKNQGTVTAEGQEWSARSQSPDEIILKNTVVTIKEIQGVKLIVEKYRRE